VVPHSFTSGMALAAWVAPPKPANIWTSWYPDPVVIAILIAIAVWYGRGFRCLWDQGGADRATLRWRAVAFAGALLTLVATLLSPLDALTQSLLSAHMVEYLILTTFTALLLVVARPVPALAAGLPAAWLAGLRGWWERTPPAHAVWRALQQPVVAAALDVIAVIVWHIPGVYETALSHRSLHVVQQLCFLGPAILLWRLVMRPSDERTFSHGRVLLSLIGASLLSTCVGLLMYAGTTWYPIYIGRTAVWGVSVRTDQQMAGLLLGVVPEIADVITFLVVLAGWLQAEEARAA